MKFQVFKNIGKNSEIFIFGVELQVFEIYLLELRH